MLTGECSFSLIFCSMEEWLSNCHTSNFSHTIWFHICRDQFRESLCVTSKACLRKFTIWVPFDSFIWSFFGNSWYIFFRSGAWFWVKFQIVFIFLFPLVILSLQSPGSGSPSPSGAESSSSLLHDDGFESSLSTKEVCLAFCYLVDFILLFVRYSLYSVSFSPFCTPSWMFERKPNSLLSFYL